MHRPKCQGPLLLQTAIEAFEDCTHLRLRPLDYEVPVTADGTLRRIDALVALPKTGKQLFVKIKNTLTRQNVSAVAQQLRELGPQADTLLVAGYVNTRLAETLRELDTQFIDTAGNAYLNQPELFILITGRRRKTKAGAEPGLKRPLQAAGLKLAFALLEEPALVRANYRTMAKAANVGLGTVGDILKNLQAHGFLEAEDKERHLIDRRRLQQYWAEHYPDGLRKQQYLGTFTTDKPEALQTLTIEKFGATWGGEFAAAAYTHYLTPRDAIVYLPEAMLPAFMQEARMRRIRAGEVPTLRIECYEPFWTEDRAKFAPPLVTYADLLATGDVRNLEAAEKLYAQFLG